MKQFGTSGMDLYVMDDRMSRMNSSRESIPASTERRSTWTLLGHAIRNGFARVR